MEAYGTVLEYILYRTVFRHVRYGVIVCGLLRDNSIPYLNQGKQARQGKEKKKKEKKKACVWERKIWKGMREEEQRGLVKERRKEKKASRALPFYFQGCAGGMTGRSTGGSDRAFGIF